MKYIVYCTTNLINSYIYIGVHQTKDPNKFDGYLGCGAYASQPSTYNKGDTAFQKAVHEFGPKNFKRVVLKTFDDEDEAYFLVEDIVTKDFIKRKDVYNMVVGGKSGLAGWNSKKCYQYDLNGNFIAEYESEQQAALAVDRGLTVIKRAIHFKTKSAGYYWSEEKVDKLNLEEFKTTDNRIPVFQYSMDGTYDCCYESVSDAARVNNVESTIISRSCSLGYKVKNKLFSYTLSTKYIKPNTGSVRNKKIYQYSLEGEYLNEYENCRQAEIALGLSQGLSQAIKLKRTFGGFQWKLDKFDHIGSVVVKHTARKVGRYDLEGNLLQVYNTVTECTKDYSGCRHVLQGKRKTSGGFIFKYLD